MIEYIIVQAGGRGSRLDELTKNKPKALVPVDNLPMLFHLFRQFPDRKFIIIGDYKFGVLEKYLQAFAGADYRLVNSHGKTGNCAGLSRALSYIPDGAPLLLIWCDLILPDGHLLPDGSRQMIGISRGFPCRWKYENGKLAEEPSSEYGVAGYFVFREKAALSGVPESGEFAAWLQQKEMSFEPLALDGTREYGLYSEWAKLPMPKCRPFNRLERRGDRIVKYPIDGQGRQLAKRETDWYRLAAASGIRNIPHIDQYEPLCMEYIEGKNLYETAEISPEEKKRILARIVSCLKEIHSLGQIKADRDSCYEAYIGKTAERLAKVRELIPFAGDRRIRINGRSCRNVFYHLEELEALVMSGLPEYFCVIHGDCTFSNILLREDHTPVLIDPRGYFGHTEICGDPAYDWAKLYYSLVSNYDQFNLKRFRLDIGENEVSLEIASSHWESMEDTFFSLLSGEVTPKRLKLLLSIIWLSLTSYAWENYDSVCGAFYQGLYYLEEVLP